MNIKLLNIIKDKTCCFTGPRPDKLYGYDLSTVKYKELINLIKVECFKLIEETNVDTFISGSALGFDTLAFIAVHNLKIKYPHIRNILAVPYACQGDNWEKAQDIKTLEWMKERADEIIYVDDVDGYKFPFVNVGEYATKKLDIRNHFMVDCSKYLITKWDGSKGGTCNCINYAYDTYGKDIEIFFIK